MRCVMSKLYLSPEDRYGLAYYSYAQDFRNISLEIDNNPSKITDYYNLPGINFLVSDKESTTLERTKYLEAFAYGDPGVLLASPGPSLSGLMMRELGTEEQIGKFYDDLKKYKRRTFFALTEPNKGSDANHIEAQLIKQNGKYFLTGVKCFFGNANVAETGIVFARINSSPVGLKTILITPDILHSNSVERSEFEMFSLRGAQIGVINFTRCEIPEVSILGLHKSSCESGFLAITKVFNRLRTGVGALAIGQAQGVCDVLYQFRKQNNFLSENYFNRLNSHLQSARSYLHFAASEVDENPFAFYHATAAKILAVRAAVDTVSSCFSQCAYDELEALPWIVKAYRDVFSWEFMEGTADVLKQLLRHKRLIGGKNESLPRAA